MTESRSNPGSFGDARTDYVYDTTRQLYLDVPEIKFPIHVQDFLIPLVQKRFISGSGVKFAVTVKVGPALEEEGERLEAYGSIFRFPDSAEILCAAELNTCWKRFVTAKEITHLLIDNEESHYTTDPVELVQQLVTSAPFPSASGALNSEHLALWGAIELLMPWRMMGEINRMRAEKKTDLQIAKFVMMPEVIVGYALSKTYRTKVDAWHQWQDKQGR